MAKIYGEIGASALMTFDKSFARSNGQPLDSTEVFYSKSAAETYAAGEVAYVGQKIVVVETKDDVTKVTHYGIEPDNSLKELGASVVGDTKSIVVAENGTISLVGVGGLVFTETTEGGEEVAVTYQPLMTSAGLTWVRPSATTVEGLATEIEDLKTRIGAVEDDAHEHANADVLDGITAEKVEKWDGAVAKEHEHANADVLSGIDADKVAAWDNKAEKATTLAGYGITDAYTGEVVDQKIEAAISAHDKALDEEFADLSSMIGLENVPEGSTVVGMVESAQDDIDTLVGDDSGKSVRAIANEELAAQLIADGAAESLDTLQEIAAWIQSHPNDAAAMNLAIEALQNQLIGIDAGNGTVKKYVDDAIVALNIGNYALAADLTALAGRVDALEKDTHTHGNAGVLDGITAEKVSAWDVAQQNVIDAIDEEQFALDADKKLSLKDVAIDKVSGLQDALDGKAAKGTTLAEYGITDAYTKTETEGRIQEVLDGLSDTSETAASVAQALETYKTSNDGRVDAIEAHIENVEEGAQVNKIEGASDEFAISDEKILSVVKISQEKVDGLPGALNSKVDKVDGMGLSHNDFTDELLAKLNGVDEGAQVNAIEIVKMGGVAIAIAEDKSVDIPGALQASFGVVKGTDAADGVSINDDHTMVVNSLNVNKLYQDDGDVLILDGGSLA